MAGKPSKKTPATTATTVTVEKNTSGHNWLDAIPAWAPQAILLLTALLYSRVIFSEFTFFDDDTFVLGNPLIVAPGWDGIFDLFTKIVHGKYQPLITLTYLLEYRLFGFSSVAFHVVSVLLHMAGTWFLFKFAKELSGKQVTAFVVAIIFALHPMHVEEVAWVSELKDTLPGLFFICTMLWYVRYLDSGYKPKNYALVFVFFLCALFSKFASITLPVILIGIDLYKGRQLDKRAWLEKIPFFALALFFGTLGFMSQQAEGAIGQLPAANSFFNRIFLFTTVPSFYIVRFFAPFHLAAMHYYPIVTRGAIPWPYYASMPFLIAVLWLMFRPSPFRRELIFGFAFFCVSISVMEQIVSVGPSVTPERYTYIPYIGFSYVLGQWLSYLWTTKWKKIAIGGFYGVMLLFCGLTWARVGMWKDSNTIFWDTITKNPGNHDCYYPYYILGNARISNNNFKEAIDFYNESIFLNPNFAESYDARGVAYFQLGDLKSGLLDLDNAIRLNPKKAITYNNRASLKASMGDFAGAIADYDHYIATDPKRPRVFADRGMAKMSLGDTAAACQDFETSLQRGNGDAATLVQRYCQ